jgi:hypothetical protein
VGARLANSPVTIFVMPLKIFEAAHGLNATDGVLGFFLEIQASIIISLFIALH